MTTAVWPPPRRVPVTIDARGLGTAGLGRYAVELLPHLAGDPRLGPVALLGSESRVSEALDAAGLRSDHFEVRDFPAGYYGLRHQRAWLRTRGWLRARGGVLFLPHYDGPLIRPGLPVVVTAHDLIQYRVPGFASGWKAAVGKMALRRTLSGATLVLTVSEYSRRDLESFAPQVAERIRVVPDGVSPHFLAAGAAPPAASPGQAPYLLCVGNRKPHKNLVLAVEVLARVRRRYPDLRLRVVGEEYPYWERVLRRARALGVADAIDSESGVNDARLTTLYRGCRALLFPSLYEGFGLPPLEAMACGTPVIASNRTSVPEVVGDAALVCDPDRSEEWVAAVERVLSEDGLRAELSRRGRVRAAGFSWERAGRQVADLLYAAALGGERKA